MPEYLAPGVFIEEIERGPRPIESVSTSTAAFIGETERGPLRPRLITSYNQYRRLYGNLSGPGKYLPYSVKAFFENGGSHCYVTRIVGQGAGTAELTVAGFNMKAIGPGPAYSRVWVRIDPSTTIDTDSNSMGFRLRVYYWADPTAVITAPSSADDTTMSTWSDYEDFDNLSVNPDSTDYFMKRVNDGKSSYVEIEPADSAKPALLTSVPAGERLASTVAAGNELIPSDYEGDNIEPHKRTGLAALDLDEFREVAIVYAPNAEPAAAQAVIAHCEKNTFRFAVVDCPPNQANEANLKPREELKDSEYAAYYYPWLWVIGPSSGERIKIPPGGALCGIYARIDKTRGVFKAPANETVTGAIALEFDVNQRSQESLNPRGVNTIRLFQNRGIRVWGARTLSSDPEWKYINVRRLFIFLEASIFNSTQWVVFESNDDRLWASVKQAITVFLRKLWREGAFQGATEEEAFSVRIGRETMTEGDILNGRLIIEIGVAPLRPAEFVIFRVGQKTLEAR